jgi:hypothetical protein
LGEKRPENVRQTIQKKLAKQENVTNVAKSKRTHNGPKCSFCSSRRTYCILGRGKINAWLPRSARAWDFVNFREKNSCNARARRARAGLAVYPSSRALEPLAFDEYCRFDTSACAGRIKRASLPDTPRASRSIKKVLFIKS